MYVYRWISVNTFEDEDALVLSCSLFQQILEDLFNLKEQIGKILK